MLDVDLYVDEEEWKIWLRLEVQRIFGTMAVVAMLEAKRALKHRNKKF